MLADVTARDNQDFPSLSPLYFYNVIISKQCWRYEGLELRLHSDLKEYTCRQTSVRGTTLQKMVLFTLLVVVQANDSLIQRCSLSDVQRLLSADVQ